MKISTLRLTVLFRMPDGDTKLQEIRTATAANPVLFQIARFTTEGLLTSHCLQNLNNIVKFFQSYTLLTASSSRTVAWSYHQLNEMILLGSFMPVTWESRKQSS